MRIIFFFSSRRRHTRCSRDWSSDVCSSDLLALMLLATAVVRAIERHRFGAYLTAIRQDESACEALGVDTLRVKMQAMVLSSFLTGVGGTFYAFYLFSLQPNAVFGIPLSVEIIIRP